MFDRVQPLLRIVFKAKHFPILMGIYRDAWTELILVIHYKLWKNSITKSINKTKTEGKRTFDK